ncbi:MAG TPA: hypothetical protein VMV31_03545 [Terriglobales bacterium]|nr:hypothetical protein [Terriglobales bacterium]
MAFVRKKGKSYYLVHNVREDGHVRQVHLACLGNRPRVSDEVLAQVRQAHPQLQIDWEAVRARAAETFVSPFADLEGVALLLRSIRTLHQDLEELNLTLLRSRLHERGQGEEAEARVRELLGAMEGLRAQLDAKLKHQPATHLLHSETERRNTGD